MTTEAPPDGDWIDVKLTLSLQAVRFLRHLSDLTSASFDDLASRLVSQALEQEVSMLIELSQTPGADYAPPGIPQTDTPLSFPLGSADLPSTPQTPPPPAPPPPADPAASDSPRCP